MLIFTNDDYRRIQAWLKKNAIKDSDFTISQETIPEEDILVITLNMATVPTNYKIKIKDLLNSSLGKVVINSIIAKSVKVNNLLTVDASNIKLDNKKGVTLQNVLDYFDDNKLNKHTDNTLDGNLTIKKNITIEGNIKSNDGTTIVEADLKATGEITDGDGNILSDVNDAAKQWSLEYQDSQQDEPTVRAKYVLKDYKGVPKGDTIKVYKDSAITNVYLGTTEDICDENTGEVTKKPIQNNNESLSIVYRLDTGKYSLVNVPIGIFTREAEFDKYRGLGITENGQVFIKLANDVESSNYLHFNASGEISADGIENRILQDLGTIINSVADDSTMWGQYKKEEGTKDSPINESSRWGQYKQAEASRNEELNNLKNKIEEADAEIKLELKTEIERATAAEQANSQAISDLETKAVPFNEQVGAVQIKTGDIVTGYSGYHYVDIDISNIRKLRIKGQNNNAGFGYAIFKEDGSYIKSEGGTYTSSTFSDIELTFSDEAKRLRFCYHKPTNAVQKINVIEYKNDSLIDKTNLLAKQSFTLGSITDVIKDKFINSSGVLSANQSYSTKYFAVKKGDKVQVENYVKGNYASSPISFVLGEEVVSYTRDSLLNEDNSTGYFTAPQDCLCYIPRYNSSNSDNAIINIIHSSLVDFIEDIQKDLSQDIDLIKDNSLSLDNRYQYKAVKRLENGILVNGNTLTFCDDTFYKAKKGEVLLFKDIYNTNVKVDLISIYSDATEDSYIKTLYVIQSNSTQSKQPDVRVEIPQDCFFRISTASNSQKECPLKVYRTIPLYDVVNDINAGINGFKDVYDEEKTIQVPLVAEVGKITKYYKCSDKCLIVCDDFVNNNNNLRFHTIKDDPFSIETINIRARGHFEYTPPHNAKYFSISLTNALDSETGKVKLIVPSNFYYTELGEADGAAAKPIVISGDSVAGNLQSKFVSTLINGETAIFPKAAGSEGPWSTMMRMGWAPCMVFPFTIPASNKYGVKVDVICNMHYKPTIKEDGTSEFTVTDTMTQVDFLVSIWDKTTDNKPYISFAGFDCEINGIRGTLGTSSGVIIDENGNLVNPDNPSKRLVTIFQRKDEGDEVVINSPVLVKPLYAETYANAYHINFMGQNRGVRDVDNDFFITDTQDTPGVDFAEVFFNMQKLCFNAAAGNYMIIGCLFKGYTEDNFQKGFRGKYERLCEKEFGAKFVNLRQYMITQAHLACGRTLSQEDKDMIKTGQLPPYLGDVHLNELGQELTANLVAERCYELGWIKNKPNYYDVVATRTRLEAEGTI